MPRRWLAWLFLAFPFALACAAQDIPGVRLEGYWSGVAERAGQRSEIAVRIRRHGEGFAGSVDWPSMGYFRADLLGVQNEASSVRFGVPLPVGAMYLGGTVDGERIAGLLETIGLVDGEWQSIGGAGTFELQRGAEPADPYTVEELRFRSGEAQLQGALFLPRGKTRAPGVVYLAGSGDTTRGDGSFLADRLARAGIAALVYDKRGAGASTGSWRSGGFEELADDADAALRLLQAHAGIDARRTGFVCQSQGCWVAPLALRRGAPARFLVAQSAPAVSVADEDLDHYRVLLVGQGFGEADIQAAFELLRLDQQLSRGKASWEDLQAAMKRSGGTAWFEALHFEPAAADDPERAFSARTLDYDPAADIDALHIPSLWIYGEADNIIPVQASIARLRAARPTPRPQLLTLPGAGHSFTVDTASFPRLAEGYPALVAEWIVKQH